jgi:hypothetical protein
MFECGMASFVVLMLEYNKAIGTMADKTCCLGLRVYAPILTTVFICELCRFARRGF